MAKSCKRNTNNPFYDNHVFNEEDLQRAIITKWDKLWLWLFPTYVQVNNEDVFHFKIVGGRYYLMKVEALENKELGN